MREYNGYASYELWNQSLWINNDEGLYNLAVEYAEKYGIEQGALILFNEILDGENTGDSIPYTLDGVTGAMQGII